jgi:hypothetical protein
MGAAGGTARRFGGIEMRINFGLAVFAAAVALAGCKSDEQQMAEARKEIGEMCRKSPPAGVDAERFCPCVIDKSIGTKTANEMRGLSEKDAQELGTKAAIECLSQPGMMPGAPAAPQAAPADAGQKGGEAVEEGVDEAN